jgi:hypothetical protein
VQIFGGARHEGCQFVSHIFMMCVCVCVCVRVPRRVECWIASVHECERVQEASGGGASSPSAPSCAVSARGRPRPPLQVGRARGGARSARSSWLAAAPGSQGWAGAAGRRRDRKRKAAVQQQRQRRRGSAATGAQRRPRSRGRCAP